MQYRNRQYYIEGINVKKLVNKFGSPSYVYSYKKIKENIIKFKNNFESLSPLICFSVKSNSNLEILRIMNSFGIGADVVSIGEIMVAIKAGINPKKIVFSGVGKTSREIDYAIKKEIFLINTESEEEIIEIEKIAKKRGKIVDIGVRLNPDTDAKTLQKISTGKKENKFGLDQKKFLNIIKRYKGSKYINISCLSVHIGSQITKNNPYEKMISSIQNILNKVNYKFRYIDLGGGMGIKYHKKDTIINYKKYCNLILKFLKQNKVEIIFEPGRSLIGNAGVLISKIIYVKNSENRKFIIMDAAMNDFIRPALYGAKHNILPVIKNNIKIKKKHEFVGPICETTDIFLSVPNFQKLSKNDLLIICDVGAYGMVLSSNYNMRPTPPELLINGNKIKIIKKRQKLIDLI